MPESIFENFRFDGRKLTWLFYHTLYTMMQSFHLFTFEVHANLIKCPKQGFLPGFQLWLQKIPSVLCKSYIYN